MHQSMRWQKSLTGPKVLCQNPGAGNWYSLTVKSQGMMRILTDNLVYFQQDSYMWPIVSTVVNLVLLLFAFVSKFCQLCCDVFGVHRSYMPISAVLHSCTKVLCVARSHFPIWMQLKEITWRAWFNLKWMCLSPLGHWRRIGWVPSICHNHWHSFIKFWRKRSTN